MLILVHRSQFIDMRVDYGIGNELDTRTNAEFRELVSKWRTCEDVMRDPWVKATLGYGENVAPHIGSVKQAGTTPLFDGMHLSLHEVSCSKEGILPKYNGLRVAIRSLDHLPAHVHIQTADGKPLTRYTWPERLPYPGDSELTGSLKKNFDAYVEKYGSDIDANVRTAVNSWSGNNSYERRT